MAAPLLCFAVSKSNPAAPILVHPTSDGTRTEVVLSSLERAPPAGLPQVPEEAEKVRASARSRESQENRQGPQ